MMPTTMIKIPALALIATCGLLAASVAPAQAQESFAPQPMTLQPFEMPPPYPSNQRPDQERHLSFELDVYSQDSADPSLKALDSDGMLVGPSLGIGYAPLEALPGLRAMFLFQSITNEGAQRFNGDLALRWDRWRFMLGLDYGHDLFGFLRPSARVAAGYSLQALEDQSGGAPLLDFTHNLAVLGALGLEAFLDLKHFLPPDDSPWNRLRIGLRYQYGYSWQGESRFDELRDRTERDEPDPWAAQDVNFGQIRSDGTFWTLGFQISYAL
jgi:hypothetical protein